MLKVTYKSSSRGTLERKVRAKIGAIAMLWDDLERFEELFKREMERMPRLNHISAEFAFRLKASGTNDLAVWHYTPEGDPDRLIAVITQYTQE